MQFIGRGTARLLPGSRGGEPRPIRLRSPRRTQEDTMQVNITFRHLEPTEALKEEPDPARRLERAEAARHLFKLNTD